MVNPNPVLDLTKNRTILDNLPSVPDHIYDQASIMEKKIKLIFLYTSTGKEYVVTATSQTKLINIRNKLVSNKILNVKNEYIFLNAENYVQLDVEKSLSSLGLSGGAKVLISVKEING